MWLFSFTMLGVLLSIWLMLRHYKDKSVALVVQIATAYAWLTAMTIVAIVPLDTFATLNHRPNRFISGMWQFVFWSTQLLTWLLLPFFQYYSQAGQFSVWGKSLYSLKENGILYGSIGAVSGIGVAALLISGNMTMDALVGLGVGLSNAFGLLAGILLLGYGLVEIPRTLWKSDPEMLLKWCAHRSGKYAENVMRGTQELETVVTIIYANMMQMRRHDPLRKYIDIISTYAEAESPVKPSALQSTNVDIEGLKAEDLEYNYDKAGLEELRRRLIAAIVVYQGARAQYEQVMVQAFELEQIVKARQLRLYTPTGTDQRPITKALWYYKCVIRPVWHKVGAVMLGATSLIILWAEATIAFEEHDLSPLSLGVQYFRHSEILIQAIVLLPLAYVCACSYMTLFSINFSSSAFDYNKLIPHATVGAALMQNGSLMCRFAAPTCWNFYHIIRMTSTVKGEETVFTQQMGSMDVPEVLRSHLNVYIPIILVLHCAITAANLWERICSCCTSRRFKFTNDDVDDEYTEKGRLLIRKEQEAIGKGYRIGEVLHSAYLDLEFPALVKGGKSLLKTKKKGNMFSRMFGAKDEAANGETVSKPSSSAAGAAGSAAASAKPMSAAAQAASKWSSRGLGAGAGGAGLGGGANGGVSGLTLQLGGEKPTSQLLSLRYGDKSASDTASDNSSAKSGLDGIFADLSRGPKAASSKLTTSSAAAAHSHAPTASGSSSTVLTFGPVAGGVGGVKKAPAGEKETDSLLGGLWGRG